jgi:hypothetical protein
MKLDGVVPYGYDYTCEKGTCEGIYKSFNSPKFIFFY